ncbi:MAG: ATP-binding protein [Bacteroidales bacterium]|jgi:predicted AAA+ superfamily ATPase|nr:ATP-binding protein [Bacteroidales bacterium]
MTEKRNIESSIRKLTSKYPIIAVTGPRQSGKTTMLREMFSDYKYVNLENPDLRAYAENDTKAFLNEYDSYVVIDEAQRVPSLFSYLQPIVDESKIMGQFILSGSQNFHLMQHITQSLAGRVAIFKLFPFDNKELKLANWLNEEDYLFNILRGYYPAIYQRDINSKTFYSNYVQTYVQRDVTELLNVKDIRLFQNFLGLCASRAGQLLNLNALAKECGISQPTAKAWLSVLENSYVLFLLHPYYKNFSKRIVKTPKLYFYDTGLLSYLLKIFDIEQLQKLPVKGALFENAMVAEYYKQMYHNNDLKDVWFWRDSADNEVDLLVENANQYDVIEFKSTSTIMPDVFKGLNYFSRISNLKNLNPILVYSGTEKQRRTKATVLPWNEFGLDL